MKTSVLLCAALLAASSSLRAQDLDFAQEGSPAQRSRLAEVQDAPAPPFSLAEWTNSAELKLADLKGKIVVLDFWATWCGPCIASIPHNNELSKKYASKGVVFVGVCHPRGAEKMRAVAAERGITYPIAIDTEGKAIAAYAVNGYPDYYIIGKDGRVLVADCANGAVEAVLEKLTN